jgi:hypothetical protein
MSTAEPANLEAENAALRAEIAALRAGEDDTPVPAGSFGTPEQMLYRVNRLTRAERQQWIHHVAEAQEREHRCFVMDHVGKIEGLKRDCDRLREQVRDLAARPTQWAYEAACEALEKRRVALAEALGLPNEGFYEAVKKVAALLAEVEPDERHVALTVSHGVFTATCAQHAVSHNAAGMEGMREVQAWADQHELEAHPIVAVAAPAEVDLKHAIQVARDAVKAEALRGAGGYVIAAAAVQALAAAGLLRVVAAEFDGVGRSVYVGMRDGEVDRSECVNACITFDRDAHGGLLGVEILGAVAVEIDGLPALTAPHAVPDAQDTHDSTETTP